MHSWQHSQSINWLPFNGRHAGRTCTMTPAKDIRAHTFVNFSSTPGSHCNCEKPLKNCSSRCLYQLLTELAQKAIANKSKWRQDKTSNLRWRNFKFAPSRSKIVCMSRCGIIKAIKIQRRLVIRVFRFILHMNLWITIALIQSRKWLLLFTYKTWNPSWNQPRDWVTFTRDNINNHKTSQHKQILFTIQLGFAKRDTMCTINLSFSNKSNVIFPDTWLKWKGDFIEWNIIGTNLFKLCSTFVITLVMIGVNVYL